MKNYTIISGTGRAGTTLLVRILAKAGLNVGFDPENLIVDPIAHAGLEWDIRTKPACSIVKSPWIATYIEELLSDPEVAINHTIICMRNLPDAAESRRRVQGLRSGAVPGGLWGTLDPRDQEAYLADIFYRLIFHLTERDVPTTFLHFPRFATDPVYCVDKLARIFPAVDPKALISAHQSEVATELITDFQSESRACTCETSKRQLSRIA